ncbi:MAG: GNAT family N-acetyltransferase [Candidatus Sumerlaeaceae bacterium]|nr:GNAT family N-acetyltransferase [Candidatus Sumerlaeaceae bacterium]
MTSEALFREVPWETRNLGIPSFELQVEALRATTSAALSAQMDLLCRQHERFFAQARLNQESTDLIPRVQRAGFVFVEVIVTTAMPVPKAGTPFGPEGWTVDVVDRADAVAMAEIRRIARESFVDDRFHRDPCCTHDLADKRFVLWIGDLEKNEKAVFYAGRLNGQIVGFVIRAAGHVPLMGFERACVGKGLGKAIMSSVLADMQREDLPMLTAEVSLNNLPSLNLFLSLGCRIRNPRATFHYWSDPPAGTSLV